MIPLTIKFIKNDEVAWPELDYDNVKLTPLPPDIAIIDGGMGSGNPSVGIKVTHPDGTIMICETSAKLFLTFIHMINAKYPGLLD